VFNQSRLASRAIKTLAAPVILAGAIAGVGPATAASAATSAATCEAWTGVPPASPGTIDNTLTSVTVLSPCDAWAVGFDIGASAVDESLIEHWNGASWTVVPSPNPGSHGTILKSVRAISPTNIWAVGNFSNGEEDTLVLHWNGTSWKQITSPSPAGSFSSLNGVRAVSPSNVWAVGQSFNQAAGFRTLIEHFNGHQWSQVTSPNPGGPGADNVLNAVVFTSATNAWAVGRTSNSTTDHTLILHFNGKTWAQQKSPTPGNGDVLWSVAASSAGNAWAVGANSDDTQTLILHWTGTKWTSVTSPDPGGAGNPDALRGVTVTSASNAWAVGFTSAGPLILHWNGNKWSQVRSPAGIELDGVAASSAGNAWTVGNSLSGSVRQALAVHCC
jgi:hypothetical protein